jgi:hypothetical protein
MMKIKRAWLKDEDQKTTSSNEIPILLDSSGMPNAFTRRQLPKMPAQVQNMQSLPVETNNASRAKASS